MLAKIKSELAYGFGLLRVVRDMRNVSNHPERTLGDYLEVWAQANGDRPALDSERESLTYRQLNDRAHRYARWAYDLGLRRGDVVALMMPNRPEYLAIWFGLARAGVATALINTNLTGPSLAHCVAVVEAKAAIVDSRLVPVFSASGADLPLFSHGPAEATTRRIDLEIAALDGRALEPAERPAMTLDDVALYIYTSGTTGLPKAARITHSRALRAMLAFRAAVNSGRDDRTYLCLPMYHTNGGLLGPGQALPVGGSVFIRERFSASAFWDEAVRENCTLFVYIGELCRYLVNAPASPLERAHKIRACFGNGLRPDIFEAFQTRFGISRILEFYAATEGNAAMINFDSRAGSIGRIPGWAKRRFPMKVVAFDIEANAQTRDANGRCIECAPDEPGELVAEILDDPRTPAARFDGYADPVATRQKILRDAFAPGDAWFRTGDLVRRDASGYFYFVDRIGDTFRWKGENVSTTEVAETIALFEGVQEAIVYGVEVPNHDGRAGMAALVLDNVAEFDLDGLLAFLSARLPAYARPVFLRFRSHFDVTGTFKPRKMDLVSEGFDPARVTDPVYVEERGVGYRPVDEAFVEAIRVGVLRL